jgi:sialate O-acetylesterase
MRTLAVCLCLLLPALASAAASFSFSSLFSNGMTLQSGEPAARVWGWAEEGTAVTVYQRDFNHTGSGGWARPWLACTATARASDGLWVAQLPPTPAGGPYRLEFYAASAAGAPLVNATLDWLWFGDVFLASGQSNMGIPVANILGPKNESAWEMAQYLNAFYGVRALQVPAGAVAASPQAQISTTGFQLAWAPLSNTTVASFSAVGAFTTAGFVDAAGAYNNRSAGVVQACWGGTSINIWLPKNFTAACPTTFAQTPATIEEGPSSPGSVDSSAYDAMIAPLTVGPLAIKGVIWYQVRVKGKRQPCCAAPWS